MPEAAEPRQEVDSLMAHVNRIGVQREVLGLLVAHRIALEYGNLVIADAIEAEIAKLEAANGH